ncbi:MAG: hypothetical protein WC955_03885 [Elusimicrobiota bacterium]
MAKLEKEYKFFISTLPELIKEHNGEYVVIKGKTILGYYSTINDAIKKTSKDNALGTFLVKLIENQDESNVMRFHSRVYAAR